MADKKKEMVKHVKKLNKLELVDKVQTKGDLEEITEDFISAIEEIDDDGAIDKVDDSILDYYESLLDGDGKKDKKDEDGDEDVQDRLSEMSAKELKAFVEENDLDIDVKISKKNLDEAIEAILDALEAGDSGDDAGDDEGGDLEELLESLEDMDDMDDLEDFIEDNDLKVKVKKNDDEEDVKEKIVKALKKTMTPKKDKKDKKGKDKKDKKGKDKKKDKKGKDKKKSKLKSGTLPALLFAAIEEGDATWKDLADIVAEEKNKNAEQCMGIAFRTVSRKIAKKETIIVTLNGEDEEAVFNLEDS